MASEPVLKLLEEGKLEFPIELSERLHLKPGSGLRVVYANDRGIMLEPTMPLEEKTTGGNWRRLEGILKDSGFDPNADLEAERLREIERDERWGRG